MKTILQLAGIAIVLSVAAPALFVGVSQRAPSTAPVDMAEREPGEGYEEVYEEDELTGPGAAFRADSDFGSSYSPPKRKRKKKPASAPAPAPAEAAAVAAVSPDLIQNAKRTKKTKLPSGRARIPADARGHFVTDAKLNGRRVEVMVDTGATNVSINRSLARRLGLRVNDSDFKHTANTANGQARMALDTLKSVRIGTVMVRDVEVAILEDGSLDSVLLGMSFLGKLRSFGVERGDMVLVR